MENMECLIVKVHAPVINQSLLDHSVSLSFVSSYLGAKNSVKRAPASSALTKSCTEPPQIVAYAVVEKGIEHKREQN